MQSVVCLKENGVEKGAEHVHNSGTSFERQKHGLR
jgi:hypothetical protein